MSRLVPVQRIARANNDAYKLLSNERLAKNLLTRPHWKLRDNSNEASKNAIIRNFQFNNFLSTRAFIQDLLEAADKYDHHPELKNVYTTVNIVFNTHDAGGLTELDFEMANEADKAFENAQQYESIN